MLKYTAKFESFDDLPWFKEDMIPILDNTFPGSKFIYLSRDEESWKNSYSRWTYIVTGEKPDVDTGWKRYKAHETFVVSYFKDRSADDFITLNVKDKKGVEKLAKFLNKQAPQSQFYWKL